MDSKLEAAAKIYDERGFAKRSGCGDRPALLIIDMTKGVTDPASPMGRRCENSATSSIYPKRISDLAAERSVFV